MILSLGDVCSLATQFSGGRADVSLSEASRLANIAYQEVAQMYGHRPPQSIAVSSTTSGENRYATPSDFDYVTAFTIYQGSSATTGSRTTTPIPLIQRDANWVDAQTLTPSGIPSHYVNYSTYVEVWPSPNSAYSMQLRYQAKLATLVNSTDTLALDDRWHPAVAFKAAEYCAAARNYTEGEAMARNRYLSYVNTIPSDTQLKQRDRASMSLSFGRQRS